MKPKHDSLSHWAYNNNCNLAEKYLRTLDITRMPKLYTSSVSTITQFVDILMYFPTMKERMFKLTCFRGQSLNIIGF